MNLNINKIKFHISWDKKLNLYDCKFRLRLFNYRQLLIFKVTGWVLLSYKSWIILNHKKLDKFFQIHLDHYWVVHELILKILRIHVPWYQFILDWKYLLVLVRMVMLIRVSDHLRFIIKLDGIYYLLLNLYHQYPGTYHLHLYWRIHHDQFYYLVHHYHQMGQSSLSYLNK